MTFEKEVFKTCVL